MVIQWNLRIKDTLGSATLSSVERLSFSWRLKMYYCYGKGDQKSVPCREVVPFSEGPLSEVPLYCPNCQLAKKVGKLESKSKHGMCSCLSCVYTIRIWTCSTKLSSIEDLISYYNGGWSNSIPYSQGFFISYQFFFLLLRQVFSFFYEYDNQKGCIFPEVEDEVNGGCKSWIYVYLLPIGIPVAAVIIIFIAVCCYFCLFHIKE